MQVGSSTRTLPPKQMRAMKKAFRLEALTIFFLLIDIVVMYIVMGNSQAMKTAWVDNVLSLLPPTVFFVAELIRSKRPPNKRFNYGFNRVDTIAFLVASTALFALGALLLYESFEKLLTGFRPTIGTVEVFGHVIWAGWLMVGAAFWSSATAGFVGHFKLPLGKILHNKVLHTDAEMNKADLLTGLATIVGVMGVGFGIWWADAAAALFISFDILTDGLSNLKSSVDDLINRIPETVDTNTPEPIIDRVNEYLKASTWVDDSIVRFYEQGSLFFGEAYVVPNIDTGLVNQIASAIEEIRKMDWRVADFTITPVPKLEGYTKL